MRPAAIAGFLLLPTALAGQGLCLPPTSSNEAQTLAILSVPLAFTAASAPSAQPRRWTIGVEVASLPQVAPDLARPTFCRPGKGPENTDPIPVVVRPRVAVAVAGFVFEGSWTPPVRVGGVRASLFSVAVARPMRLTGSLTASIRAHAVLGGLNAPITCDDAALLDSSSECFRGTRSDDRWDPGVSGLEAVVGAGGRVRPYAGVGYTRLRPRFKVNFTNASGTTDGRRVEVDLERVAFFAGLSAPIGALDVTAEGYATAGDAITARLVVRYR